MRGDLAIFVLFLIYMTVSEFSQLFGPGEMRRLLFTSRPSELQLPATTDAGAAAAKPACRQTTLSTEFRDPASARHRELIDIVRRLVG